jgi:hypothetical protein
MVEGESGILSICPSWDRPVSSAAFKDYLAGLDNEERLRPPLEKRAMDHRPKPECRQGLSPEE